MRVHKLLKLEEFRKKYRIPRAKFVNYQVAYDGRIYMIFSAEKYYFFRITFDWVTGAIENMEQFDFGEMKVSVRFWCPFFDYFLLVSRTTDCFKKEPNAFVVDRNGNILQSSYIRDAIEDCCTTPNGRMIAGYMDMSIDNKWDKATRGGVTIWNELGRWIWTNKKYYIWHCYALNLDCKNRVWFYYYGGLNDDYKSMFHLVCKHKGKDAVFTPDIKGSDGFAVSSDYSALFLGGGYDDKSSVYRYDMDYKNQKLSNKQKVAFEFDGQEIQFYNYEFSQNKVFLLTEDGTLFTGCFDNR